MIAWHFTGKTLRDGSPIPRVGEPLIYTGEVVICKSGLHASKDPFDALQYAPGHIMHKVLCDDIVTEHHDKFVCRKRTIIQSLDSTKGLQYFARMQALSVVHLWDAPDVVLDYLMTGNVAKAASNAANAAAKAAKAAAKAAYAAAKAAYAAAYAAYAARAAYAAASAAAYAAASAAASAAAYDAYAARAANAAAYDAASAAAYAAAREEFNFLVMEAFE